MIAEETIKHHESTTDDIIALHVVGWLCSLSMDYEKQVVM